MERKDTRKAKFIGLASLHNISCTIVKYIRKTFNIKGIIHLNIIFSYMKVNKICNLDHPVY